MSATPPPKVVAPGKRISIALAVLVHLALAAFLIYGVHWQTRAQDVVEVELVRPAPSPAPVEKPEPSPKPEAKTEPAPEPKPLPKPVVKAEPKPLPPPVKPDIAIKDKIKPPPKEEPKPKPFDPFQQQMVEEEKHLATSKQIAEEERKLAQQKSAQAANQAAAARSKALASYADRIRAKIRGNIVLPAEIKGNPSALFEVTQLVSGEVLSAKLIKSSGYASYDASVERAILKSSPLPKADDPALFSRELKMTFCPDPKEDGKCG